MDTGFAITSALLGALALSLKSSQEFYNGSARGYTAFGVTFSSIAVAFGASAIYGYSTVATCNDNTAANAAEP